MIIRKEPENWEQETDEMVIIGHYEGMAIAKDENGNLFYEEDGNECLEAGTYCSPNGFQPVALLQGKADEIKRIYGNGVA